MDGSVTRALGSRRRKRASTDARDYLDEFFANYPAFVYNRSGSATDEFYRMCDFFNWDRNDEERNEAHSLFKDAITQQFNRIYGTDVNDVKNWQSLCKVIGIVPVPERLQDCRGAIENTHVNLVDLVDIDEIADGRVVVFSSELELSVYTKESGKFFPRENAYAGGLLKYLLRQIMTPGDRDSKKNNGRGGKVRGRGRNKKF
ncbi:hypothetical protein AcW1_003061 [Taiwanofungus camphoratus]|nr:hypothetical protein AcW1_003061 [Antrodia cinnamomea]